MIRFRTVILIVAMSLWLAAAASAQEAPQILHQLPAASVKGYTNEIALDQDRSFEDPVKNRCGAWQEFAAGREYYLCARSGDILAGDPNRPTRYEKVLEAIKVDRFGAGMWELFLQDRGTTDDAGMRRKITVTQDAIEFHVPVRGLVAAPPNINVLTGGGGRFQFIMQDDGNVVLYIDGVPEWSTGTVVAERSRSWRHLWLW